MTNLNDSVYLPAEWEEQSAVWFAWPSPGKNLWVASFEIVREQLIELYLLSADYQAVNILSSEAESIFLKARLGRGNTKFEITIINYETDDVWIRDYGAIFLKDSENNRIIGSDWRFNAWGGKYNDFVRDNAVADWMCQYLGIESNSYSDVLEGGAIETNGANLLCTTKSVLMNSNREGKDPSRNWDLLFKNRLNIKRVLWFESGLAGDDTDGHIDNLIRFAPDNRILFASTEDAKHVNFSVLEQLKADLKAYIQSDLAGYRMSAMPVPEPLYFRNQVLATSYVNYLVLNNAVLVPSFNQDTDQEACAILAKAYPDRTIHAFPCSEIVQEGGGLHCLSLNQPLASF